jgi:hypothetical protein
MSSLDTLLARAASSVPHPTVAQQDVLVRLSRLRPRLDEGLLWVAVLGQFKRGKSTHLRRIDEAFPFGGRDGSLDASGFAAQDQLVAIRSVNRRLVKNPDNANALRILRDLRQSLRQITEVEQLVKRRASKA